MKRAFNMKLKSFFINFKGFAVIRNPVRLKSIPLRVFQLFHHIEICIMVISSNSFLPTVPYMGLQESVVICYFFIKENFFEILRIKLFSVAISVFLRVMDPNFYFLGKNWVCNI